MKGKIFLLLFGFLMLQNFSAICEEGQIDINTASLNDLDKLSGIGPVKAQTIIDSRPYKSLEELIDVNGIGEVTLENIKRQGLACVENEEKIEEPEKEDQEEKVEEKKEDVLGETENNEIYENSNLAIKEVENERITETQKINEPLDFQEIRLNSEPLKTEDNYDSGKSFATYGLASFCLLLVALFLLKKRKYKNEFE